MSEESNGSQGITELLRAVAAEKEGACDQLYLRVEHELRGMARNRLRGDRLAREIELTSLVDDVFMKLAGSAQRGFENRRHFFGAAVTAMRRILVDRARHDGAGIRGGGVPHEPISDVIAAPVVLSCADLLALDEALDELESVKRRAAIAIMMRFFWNTTIREISEALGVASGTVRTDLAFARAWLRDRLGEGDITRSLDSRFAAESAAGA